MDNSVAIERSYHTSEAFLVSFHSPYLSLATEFTKVKQWQEATGL